MSLTNRKNEPCIEWVLTYRQLYLIDNHCIALGIDYGRIEEGFRVESNFVTKYNDTGYGGNGYGRLVSVLMPTALQDMAEQFLREHS